MAGGTFPTSVPSYPSISASETLGTMAGSVGHKATHDHEETDVTALATKVGIGSSTPAVGMALGCPTTAGTSVWTASMFQISKNTLSGATATVDFTTISNAYSALLIQVFSRGSAAVANDPVTMRVGTAGTIDTGANYDWSGIYGNASVGSQNTEGAVAATSATVGYQSGSSGTANEAGMIEIFMPAYATTTFNKRWRSVSSWRTSTTTITTWQETMGGNWRNTAAINVIRFACGGNFAIGSTFVLWGLA